MTDKKVKMELVGLDGNAFSIMGAFQNNAKRQGWTKEEIEEVLTKARSGDYDNLLRVMMEYTISPEEHDELYGGDQCNCCGQYGEENCECETGE